MKHKFVDTVNNIEEILDLTEEELAEKQANAAKEAEDRAAAELAKLKRQEALSKLAAIGLTEEDLISLGF